MLAQLFTRAIARRFASASATNDVMRLAPGRGLPTTPGEVVQLDAIGYSHDELIAREIETHREAIALYEDKAHGADPQLQVFARKLLPQLQQHLAVLEALKLESRNERR